MEIRRDLKKAYDRIWRDFLYDTVIETGLLVDLITTIIHFSTTRSMRLVWNGGGIKGEFSLLRDFHKDVLFRPISLFCVWNAYLTVYYMHLFL